MLLMLFLHMLTLLSAGLEWSRCFLFSVVGREEQNLSSWIKESMFIRVNGPSLKKNIGKYHLPHLWDEVLNNSRELKLKVDSVFIPSATKAIRSAYIPTMWLFHLPQGNNISPSHVWQQHQPSYTWQYHHPT